MRLSMEISKSKWRKIIATIAIGSFMSALDSSVVNIALPQISTHFNAPMSTIEWVVMSYLLVISSLLLTYGRIGDMYGHKKIYQTGFVLFTLGSLLCGFSPTIGILIAARAFQAIGAGMLMSVGPAIVTDVTSAKERGKALGINAVAVSVALATGPILGGALTSQFGWQSIFFINVPIGIIGYTMVAKFIPESAKKGVQKFDILGAVLVFFSLAALLLPISYAEYLGWTNPIVIISIIFSIALFIIFIFVEKRSVSPMVDLTMFQNRLFSMSNISALINFVAQFSIVLIMPFYFQQLRGMSPSNAGMMMIAMPLSTTLIAPISGSVSDKIDSRYLSSSGMLLITVGMLFLSRININSSTVRIISNLFVIGLGIGMFQAPNNSAVMGSVPDTRRGIASSVLATMRNIGMVLGIAIAGAVFTGEQNYLNISLKAKGITGEALRVQSFTGAFHVTYVMAACIAGVAIVTSLLRGNTKKL
jgi:EmrB/QacA subfamily drug resistance transporter